MKSTRHGRPPSAVALGLRQGQISEKRGRGPPRPHPSTGVAWLVAGDAGGLLYRFPLTSAGQPRAIVTLGNGGVGGLAVTSDSKRALIAGRDGSVVSVDMVKGTIIPVVRVGRRLESMALSPGGESWAIGTDNDEIVIGSVSERRIVSSFSSRHRYAVRSLSFGKDAGQLASSGWDGIARVWRLSGARVTLETEWDAKGGEGRGLAFSRDGRFVAAPTGDGLTVWTTDGSAKLRTLGIAAGAATQVAFDSTARNVAASFRNGHTVVWSLANGEMRRTLGGHFGEALSVSFLPDDRTVVTYGGDRAVILWDIETPHGLATEVKTGTIVGALALDSRGKGVATRGRLGTTTAEVAITSLSRRTISKLPGGVSQTEAGAVTASQSGRFVAATDDRLINLWATDTGRRFPCRGHDARVTAMAFSPDERRLATGDARGIVRLWSAADCRGEESLAILRREYRATVPTPLGITSVAFAPDGGVLAIGTNFGEVFVWDLARRRWRIPVDPRSFAPEVFASLSRGVTDAFVGFIGTEELVVAGDEEVSIFDPHDGRRRGAVIPLRARVRCLAAAPGARFVGLCTNVAAPDGRSGPAEFVLVDRASRQPLRTRLTIPGGSIHVAAWSADGARLVTNSSEGSVLVWDMAPASWRDRAQRLAGRSLTKEERARFEIPPP